MSKIGVGKEIVTSCSKCKLELAHLIVAMRDEVTPYKVQCKTCGSNHSFKVKKVAKRRATTGTKKKRVTAAEKILNIWEDAMENLDGDPIKYSIKTVFEAGQVIDHPKFGPGLIEKVIDANKIEVVFKTDVKILMHAK